MNDLRKTDCILYRHEGPDGLCLGLKELYCKTEDCSFYKSNKEFNQDGRRKDSDNASES